MSHFRFDFWVCSALLASLALSCGLVSPAQTPPPVQPAESASAVAQTPDPALSSMLPIILQARLRWVVKGVPQDSWVDFEVSGPAKHAFAACKALVDRERNLNLPEEVRIEQARPCSRDAMPEPPASTPFALVQVHHYDAVTLALELPAEVLPAKESEHLRVRRRYLTGFDDEASCAAMRDKIEGKRSTAAKAAQEKATEWLDDMIAKQRAEADAACKRPGSDECRKLRELLSVLEKRKAGPLEEPDKRTTPDAVCRKR